MNKLVNWLLLSSADSSKLSLTIKGASVGVITVLTMVSGLAHIQLPSDTLTALFDTAVGSLQALAVVLSGIATAVGLLRKLWLTARGENAVLNDPLI